MGKGILWGILITLACVAMGGYFFIISGFMPVNADGKPPALEKWMAWKSLHASIQREAPKGPNPVEFNGKNLMEGIKLYSANCAVCHGASDGKPSNIAMGLYQQAPQLATDGVEDDPEGVTFWKVKHGIRLTGMPGFSKALTDDQAWKLALFLKHMDSLPAKAQEIWKAVPSAAIH